MIDGFKAQQAIKGRINSLQMQKQRSEARVASIVNYASKMSQINLIRHEKRELQTQRSQQRDRDHQEKLLCVKTVKLSLQKSPWPSKKG